MKAYENTETALDALNAIPTSTLILAIVLIFCLIGWLLPKWKTFQEWREEWYKRRRRKDELYEMVENDHGRIEKYEDNRKHDRADSIRIRDELAQNQVEMQKAQKEMAEQVAQLTKMSIEREKQIQNLTVACKELLASDLNEKYKRYLALQYIPEDEFDEFNNGYAAYTGCKGNSTIEKKYQYAIAHLPVKPVDSHPVLKHDK